MSGLLGDLLGSVVSGAMSGTAPAASGGGGNAQLINAVMGLINQHGGVAGLVQQFEQSGLGGLAQSWVSSGPNRAVDPSQITQALGGAGGSLGPFAQALGVDHGQASQMLAQILPQVIDHLTPQGQVGGEHAGLLGDVAKQLLGSKLFG
jgi:uncharacterized protein YidB (DUF937 family)